MSEYPVVWKDSAHASEVWAGGLSIGDHGLRLRGANGYERIIHDICRSDVASVARADDHEQIAGFRSLRLELHTGRVFVLASVLGVGVTRALLDVFASL